MSQDQLEIHCDHCGHQFTTDTPVNWCPKCARRVFSTDKQRRAHKANTTYFYVMVVATIGILAYFFLELIVFPIIAMTGS
jgi:DNA-directed RNA polymerase subunit RPC12/RpoP